MRDARTGECDRPCELNRFAVFVFAGPRKGEGGVARGSLKHWMRFMCK